MKELRCVNCAHKNVCSLKEEFANAQDAVDRVIVLRDDHACIALNQIKWIKPVSLGCTHFMSDVTQREYYMNLNDSLTAVEASPTSIYTVSG